MITFKCTNCSYSFSEADKAWDVAVAGGCCPKCKASHSALCLNGQFDSKKYEKPQKESNLRYEVMALLIGLLFILFPVYSKMPTESELQSIEGALTTINYVRNIGKFTSYHSELQLNTSNLSFVFFAKGNLCGNVYQQLKNSIGKPLKLKYMPSNNFIRTSLNKPIVNTVYDIWLNGKPICTYDDKYLMNKFENQYSTIGGIIIIILTIVSMVKSRWSNPPFKRDY
jgi:hypothetical protein